MRTAALSLFLAVLLPCWVALADIAPDPLRLDGNARMTEESVDIQVDDQVARVTATFTLELGRFKQLQYCRALQTGGSSCGDPYYQFELRWPLLQSQEEAFKDFTVTMDGRECNVWGEQEEDLPGFSPSISKWIRITSPRMEERPRKVQVQVTYIEALQPEGKKAGFTYVLRSGALWEGTIGVAVITMSAAEGITFEDVSPTPKKSAPGKLRWEMKDFEPQEDLRVTIHLPLTPAEADLKRRFEENIRKNEELDAQKAEIDEKERHLDATYQEYLRKVEELKKKQEQQNPQPTPDTDSPAP